MAPGALADEAGRAELLRAIVETTRSVFAAQACSIMRHDGATNELVFEAVAGRGAGRLVGERIPAGTGLAGWSLASEEPIAIADVSRDPRFARDVAEGTGYVPTSIIVYPLLSGERSLGVLNVLDQSTGAQVGIADMDVLARIAAHAAIVLALVQDARDLERASGTGAPAARLERALAGADPARREAALEVMAALERLLTAEPG
ncbi:MAG: GAF domain-containing protein [Solirubrobacteraceae bacterium]